MKRHPANIVVLTLGVMIAAIGAFFPLMSGTRFRNGAPFLLAVFFIIKGSSSLRCKPTDIALGIGILALVLLSKAIPASIISPAVFQIAALVALIAFVVTGLTLKSIFTEQGPTKDGGPTH